MPVDHSEFVIVKTLDKATPKLLSDDAFVLDGTNADGVRSDETPGEMTAKQLPYMEFKLKEILISGVQQNGDGDDGSDDGLLLPAVQTDDLAVDPNNPNVDLTPGPDDNVVGVPGDTDHVTGQVTFGGSITLQNINNGVHTLDDWFHNGLLLPAVKTDDGLLLPAVKTEDTAVFTAIAMAESGGNSDAHAPRGEDSLGLWQINVEPNQYDPDAFANDLYDPPTGPAVATETLTIVHEGFWV